MSTTSSPAHSQLQRSGATLRHLFIGALFAVVLLIPKILHVRRNSKSWMLFRISLGVAGATLVLVPLSSWSNYVLAIVGLGLFVSAILLPPAKPQMSADDKARELRALIVINGGRYRPAEASSAAVQLFVGAERISVLNAGYQPLLEIPVNEITAARAEETESGWLLQVTWAGHITEFFYHGVFAEHLARVAETTLQNVMRPSLPVIPQRRAAGA
jgi:hypothetical protein